MSKLQKEIFNMSYPFGEIDIADPGELIPEAFIYKFTHKPSGMWYLGMHGLKEHEAFNDGAYWNSSTSATFNKLLEEKPEEFIYEISHFGSMKEMFKKEFELLSKMRATAKQREMSWNKWNGFAPESIELPDLDLINKLAEDAYNPDSDLERCVVKISDLDNVIRLQVRFDTNMSHKKISEYKNEMNANNSTKGFTITIVRFDGREVIVGGNHTLESARKSRCSSIEVVYIDAEMTMADLQALGNALNRKVEVQRMTTSITDCAGDLVNFYNEGKITSLKDKYVAEYIKVTGGFKGADISKVRREAQALIDEKDSWKKGKTWINWKLKKREKERNDKCSAFTSDTTFYITQSATFRADRVIEKWMQDADFRKDNGLTPRSIVKILMHYETKKTYDDYNDKNPQGGHRRIIESFMKGEGIDTPSVVFENLELYEDSI